jgi:hypothetical protein
MSFLKNNLLIDLNYKGNKMISKLLSEQRKQDEEKMTSEEINYYRNEFKIFEALLLAKDLEGLRKHDKKIKGIESKIPANYDFKKEAEAVCGK